MTDKPRADVWSLVPILRVADMPAAIRYYTHTLGFEEVWNYVDFANVRRGKAELFLGTQAGAQGGTSVWLMVTDADCLHDEVVAKGANVVMPLIDQPHHMREFTVRDPDGNLLTFGHTIHEKNFTVKRTTLEVRLEERIAKVLQDVAKATNRTVGETLEETLLHTFYNVGPHTDGTLKLIEELKQKHGLDYDVHASYNFTEE